MNQSAYRHLLSEVGACLRLRDVPSFLDSGLLEIHGTTVLLMYDEAFDADLLQIRFDLGKSPEANREALWRVLLESNFIWGEGGRFVFGLLAGRDDVVLTMQHALSTDVTGAELGDWLSAATQQVDRLWQEVLRSSLRQTDQGMGAAARQHNTQERAL